MTFEELVAEARKESELDRMRELCALVCNVLASSFWAREMRGQADGALACAQAIRGCEDVEALEKRVLAIGHGLGAHE
jgi:hypothetical protein